MHSTNLKAFLKKGVIPPICHGDLKEEVIAKLGAPNDWADRTESIGWNGPLISDFRDADNWRYGSVGITFGLDGDVEGMSIDYSEIFEPITIVEAFGDLPRERPTLGELLGFMEREGIGYNHPPDVGARTAGGVEIYCLYGECYDESPVNHLFYDRSDD